MIRTTRKSNRTTLIYTTSETDDGKKDKLPAHVILRVSDYTRIQTDHPPLVEKAGERVAEYTSKLGWTVMSHESKSDCHVSYTDESNGL